MLSSPGKQSSVFIWGNNEIWVQEKTLGYNLMISSIQEVWAKGYESQGEEKLRKLGPLLINVASHYDKKTKLNSLVFALYSWFCQ